MDRRYQVFVSSTYADLRDERQHVIQALMEMDCIPAGMELFPAADDEQWEFIKRVIDDCDYYLLIIGGRYGSTTSDGISYTEKEYDYAVDAGLKVIALLHEKPDEIPLGKSEIDPKLRERLQSFRDRVSENRLVKFWSSAKELPGLVALSLSKTIKTYPAIGWVRANLASNVDVLAELNDVRKENAALQLKIAEFDGINSEVPKNLAGLDEEYTLTGTHYTDAGKRRWSSTLSWKEIFGFISPYLAKHPSDDTVKSRLLSALIERDSIPTRTTSINDQDFQTIAIQLKSLGLVKITYSETTTGGMALFWTLTRSGESLMIELRTIRSAKDE